MVNLLTSHTLSHACNEYFFSLVEKKNVSMMMMMMIMVMISGIRRNFVRGGSTNSAEDKGQRAVVP